MRIEIPMNGRGPRIEAPVSMRILKTNLTIEENNSVLINTCMVCL